MTEHHNKSVIIGGHYIGQGTNIFRHTLEHEFRATGADVTVHGLGDASPLATATWLGIRAGYRVVPHVGRVRDAFFSDGQRREGLMTSLANRGFFTNLTGDEYIVAVHGMYGIGRDRHQIGGDTYPETFVDDSTRSYVTLPETRRQLLDKAAPKSVTIVGFMVPSELQSHQRREEIKRKFELGEPSVENPLRLAFMTTGQFNNMDYLHNTLLNDPLIVDWIKTGKAQLDIYLWNSRIRALDTYRRAKTAHVRPVIRTEYQAEFDKEYGVQIYFNTNRATAVDGAVSMAEANDILMSPAAEKVGWFSERPGMGLIPVDGNNKMGANTEWLQTNGLIGPFSELENPGETIHRQLANPGSRFRTHYERVGEVSTRVARQVGEPSFELFDAAKIIPELVFGSTG